MTTGKKDCFATSLLLSQDVSRLHLMPDECAKNDVGHAVQLLDIRWGFVHFYYMCAYLSWQSFHRIEFFLWIIGWIRSSSKLFRGYKNFVLHNRCFGWKTNKRPTTQSTQSIFAHHFGRGSRTRQRHGFLDDCHLQVSQSKDSSYFNVGHNKRGKGMQMTDNHLGEFRLIFVVFFFVCSLPDTIKFRRMIWQQEWHQSSNWGIIVTLKLKAFSWMKLKKWYEYIDQNEIL